MATPHKATPEQWGQCEADAATWGRAFPCILELRSRIEALEAAASAPADHLRDVTKMVATDGELHKMWRHGGTTVEAGLRAVYSLGRQHGAAQAASRTEKESLTVAPAPAGGLVERLMDEGYAVTHARAAILAVADWLQKRT